MSKLYVIIGGAIVIALFTALIGPWFVNWNDYKATFETEAEKILGRPVRVVGSASATLLPSPSLTFEEVAVGEVDGAPMMTVDRFEVTIELMPLLQGEFRVVSMRLDRPVARVTVSGDGMLDWQQRNEASKALDPDRVILESVEIADGHLDYVDQGTGTELAFDSINAVIEANSLLGPWRVEGSFLDEGAAVPFRFATGRRLDDGTIRVKTEISPAEWPVALAADGILGAGDDGVYYDGTYNVTEVVPAVPGEAGGEAVPAGDTTGWRSEGKFKLTRQQLAISQAVLSEGPVERPFSIAGSLTVDLGLEPKFEAHASARQIDLDRSLGQGPTEPVEVSAAAGSLVGWLTNSFVPPIPGSVFFSVPGIVVGGAVVQDVAFEARPTIGGWRLASFSASLPGQASLEAHGVLATDYEVSFAGDARLTVNQPAVFATWWRGRSEEGSGRLLAPFQLAGRAEVAPKRFAFEDIDAVVGDAVITGRFAWSEAEARKHRRILETELVADSVDFTQLKALGELIAGKDLANSAALADSYDIKLATGTLQLEDVTMREVAIDASFADDALTVNELGVGDLGGASLNVTQGKIEAISTKPRGHLDAQLEADTLVGLTRVVERVLPDHAFSQWLAKAAPSLTPAFVTASIEAPPQEGSGDFRINVSGVAASTTLSAVFDLTGGLDRWREGNAGLEIVVDSPDAAELSRQAGIATAGGGAGGTHIELTAKGVPAEGLDTRIAGDFAGVGLRANGKLALAAGTAPAFAGSVAAAADNLDPLMRMIGLDIPGAAAGTPVRMDGRIETTGATAKLALNNSRVAGRLVSGGLSFARQGESGLRVDGDLRIDAVDLGWITALGLGFPIAATGDAAAPWAKAPFAEPGYGPVSGRLSVVADELTIAEGFDATGATMTVDLEPNRIGVDLAGGQVAGGSLGGSLSIHNVGGNANASGRVDLKGASLESLIWQRGGRAVATGTLDLSAEFEAAGRSPAGLVSSLTGGGTIAIRDGEARYVNPQAARLVIKAADLGQEFTENELRDAFTEQIDGGSLAFGRAEGAFALAAGAVRAKSIAVESGEMTLVGNAVIDLNAMTIDSDWTAEFEPGDDKAQAAAPQVGIVFRGPLDDPERIVDVVQFGAYLNIRQEERLLEILSQAEADRIEREWLNREKRKLSEDAERRVREAEAARIAAEAERQRHLAAGVAHQAGAEAAGLAAEEEAARIAAEEEAARIAAEAERQRLAAEEAARIAAEEAARKAAEEEAARIAAEEEAARVAAEAERQRLAAEEAARIAAEEAARQAAAEEAARIAAVEAARKAAEEEAARIAAEAERQRLAAEEAARKAAAEEAARIAAEAERQRLAAEEAARKAAAEETARIAAEEAARKAAEEEAARVAAEAERQRLAAEEAARKAAEEEAARIAAEEAARKEEAAARVAAEAERQRLAAEEAARARVENSRAARLIGALAASGAADAAEISTNGIVPIGPVEGGTPPLLDLPPSLPPAPLPTPTPRPSPLGLAPPPAGAPMPITPPAVQ